MYILDRNWDKHCKMMLSAWSDLSWKISVFNNSFFNFNLSMMDVT